MHVNTRYINSTRGTSLTPLCADSAWVLRPAFCFRLVTRKVTSLMKCPFPQECIECFTIINKHLQLIHNTQVPHTHWIKHTHKKADVKYVFKSIWFLVRLLFCLKTEIKFALEFAWFYVLFTKCSLTFYCLLLSIKVCILICSQNTSSHPV